ncbi:Catechol 2,3-dioxygenase [Duganella sp. CF458]|uniref:VOC family protein n=1 Tax=Duganella sp. CF458 TaxID=1884368 RepID=UPI0008E2A35F|nr:VOC family protein [Duganella sp. CF458]SFG22125.1 Catechol 2,3-dioxygenase [Duganella sp. CF458]
MQLNHLDLSVPDVAAACAFLTRHFGFALLQTKGNHGMAILAGEGGVVLVLTRHEEPSYPKTFHIGFLVDDAGKVGAKHAELQAAGVTGLSPVQEMRGGPGFYCRSDWGILLEVAQRTPARDT